MKKKKAEASAEWPENEEISDEEDENISFEVEDSEGEDPWWSDSEDHTEKDWIREELSRMQWDSENNPWKRESLRMNEEKRYLENEVMRLQNKVMLLNGELNRMKSPPLIVGTIVDHYTDDQVLVSTSGGPSFVVKVLSSVDMNELLIGTKVSLNKDNMSVTAILPSSKDPLVGAAEIEERPDLSFRDVGGLEKQIKELKEVVELPLLRPDLFRDVGIDPPKGVLLIGPPGCGKTLLAKAIARETKATFLRMVGSELVQKYIGEGSRMVRELFQLAKERAPSILFLDEIDSIAGRRTDSSTSADREVHRTLIQLLAELDGFDNLSDVRIIAATNRPDILDHAILRPGRLDRIIEIPLPDLPARKEIFRLHTKRMNIDSDISIDDLAAVTEGFNGAQIKAVCTESGMFAIREERRKVHLKDFKEAIKKVKETGAEGDLFSLHKTQSRGERYSMFA
ncbi:MAG: proteasome-activating nucleotidase [Candidatus Thermoplasmatota archaeon]|nr:proteasome-activating nucleotidase [Candidatus Thermoplasmatota archaeon]